MSRGTKEGLDLDICRRGLFSPSRVPNWTAMNVERGAMLVSKNRLKR